jgi:hypothetical protein
VPLAKAYPGRKRYFSIAFPIPDSDLLVDRLKTVVGLRPSFSAHVRLGEGHPSCSYHSYDVGKAVNEPLSLIPEPSPKL